MKITCLIIFVILCFAIYLERLDAMENDQRILEERRYSNLSTSPSYVQFRLKSDDMVSLVVINNTELCEFLAGVKYTKQGLISKPSNYDDFIKEKYIPFLLEFEGVKRTVVLSAFPVNVVGVAKIEPVQLKSFLNKHLCEKILKFEDLDVSSESELIGKYFIYDEKLQYGYLREEYISRFNTNVQFISLLLSLDYDVGVMGLGPVLQIRKVQP